MSGRPDYDVGDLVVCVDDVNILCNTPGALPKLAFAYRVIDIVKPGESRRQGAHAVGWGALLEGCAMLDHGYRADRFRKLNPKPPEFFTGTIEANQREGVPA